MRPQEAAALSLQSAGEKEVALKLNDQATKGTEERDQ
jgi:hypothetical protein